MTILEDQQKKLNLKQAYREICMGYSPFEIGNNRYYFKHLTVFDKIRCDEFYEEALEVAIRQNKRREKDIFEEAQKNGQWSKENQKSLDFHKKNLQKMSVERGKCIDEDQVEQIDEIIAEYNEALIELSNKRETLTANSAENYALGEYIINFLMESVYIDKDLKVQKWNDEEKAYQKASTLDLYFKHHNQIFSRFSNENLKKIAISDYFQEGFSLVSDMSQFFNKKVFELSDYQVRLLRFGNTFKDVLTEAYDAPDEYFEDPNKLEQWYILKKNRASNPNYKNAKDGEDSFRTFLAAEKV
jgi:hypothetical protein